MSVFIDICDWSFWWRKWYNFNYIIYVTRMISRLKVSKSSFKSVNHHLLAAIPNTKLCNSLYRAHCRMKFSCQILWSRTHLNCMANQIIQLNNSELKKSENPIHWMYWISLQWVLLLCSHYASLCPHLITWYFPEVPIINKRFSQRLWQYIKVYICLNFNISKTRMTN